MPTINIRVLGSVHQISCDQGQEEHLERLSVSLNARLNSLATTFPRASDALLLVMNSLMIEDELSELKKLSGRVSNNHILSMDKESADLAMIQTLDAVTEYVENLAKKIENSGD